MKALPLITLLLAASPAFGQSRVYTNADLGQKPVTWTRTVTPEELRSLAARQFVLPPDVPDGPTVIVFGTRMELQPLPPYQPLSPPWSMTTYVGHGRRGFPSRAFPRGPRAVSARPGIHLRYP